MSLLREIQDDLARSKSDISCVLLKCKVLASRLGSSELTDWVNWELNGYGDHRPVPEYRRLAIIYYAAFMNVAWRQEKAAIPLQIVPVKHRQSFRELEFRDGIAKVASLARGDGRISVQRPELVYAVQGKMYPDMKCYGVWGLTNTDNRSRNDFVRDTAVAVCLASLTSGRPVGDNLPASQGEDSLQ